MFGMVAIIHDKIPLDFNNPTHIHNDKWLQDIIELLRQKMGVRIIGSSDSSFRIIRQEQNHTYHHCKTVEWSEQVRANEEKQ